MEQRLPAPEGLRLIVTLTIMAVLSTVAFALRVYVRSSLVDRLWEDWAAGLGWFVYILFCGAMMVGPFYGVGQHADLIPPQKLPVALRVRMLNFKLSNVG